MEYLCVRMGSDECTEEGLSSFANEVEDLVTMCDCAQARCLFLLDEFGKR